MSITRKLLPLLPLLLHCQAECIVEPDQDNVVSTQLVGTWGIDIALSQSLWPSMEVTGDETISFISDSTVLETFSQEACHLLEQFTVSLILV